MQSFILPAKDRVPVLNRITLYLSKLPERAFRLELREHRSTRSVQQNRYLWGVCYRTILDDAGEQLRGWTKDDLHEYFLGEWSGWEVIEGFGRKRMKPVNRSSRLSTVEFMDFVASIQQRAAEFGIVIPDPEAVA